MKLIISNQFTLDRNSQLSVNLRQTQSLENFVSLWFLGNRDRSDKLLNNRLIAIEHTMRSLLDSLNLN